MSARQPERGLTLVEVTVAVVLASIVLVGLVGFYLSSQATWISSSTKAVTQRDGTLALEAITIKVRASTTALAEASPDAQHMRLFLYDLGSVNPSYRFWWNAADSTLHHGPGTSTDLGSLVPSRVARFQVAVTGGSLVEVVALDMVSPSGEVISLSTAAALYNRP